MTVPKAKKIPKINIEHGVKRIDNYAWLKDDNWENIVQGNINFNNPDILNYINQENEYTKRILLDYNKMQIGLYQELLKRTQKSNSTYPVKKNDYFYYEKRLVESDYTIYCRKYKSLDNQEEIYFDENVEANKFNHYQLGNMETSDNEKFLAYTYNTSGSMKYILKIRDLSKNKDIDFIEENTNGEFLWINNDEILYCLRDDSGRGSDVFLLDLNTLNKRKVFSKDPEYNYMYLRLDITSDNTYPLIYLESGGTQVLYIFLKGTFEYFLSSDNNTTMSLDHAYNNFYLLTNNGADNSHILIYNNNQFEVFIEEKENKDLYDFCIYNNYMILFYQNNDKVIPEIEIVNLKNNTTQSVSIDIEVYSINWIGSYDFNDTKLLFELESPIHPKTTYELDIETNEIEQKYQLKIPNHNPDNYVLKREYAKSRDNKLIPLTIVYQKGIKHPCPSFVYSYGAYGISMENDFFGSWFLMADRGFIICVPHVRGGSDKGHNWYLDGKMKNKKNTFNDFIDSCEYLIDQKYTKKGKIIACGGSAGGLLMGAVLNMRPDLFAGVHADVPFVDLMTTMQDESLPLTPSEWKEWGNPIDNKDDYDYMLSYSPYDNVKKQKYPHMLFSASISDEQVTYWEATKMVAKLREHKTCNNLLLLNMSMSSGHGGHISRNKVMLQQALSTSFYINCINGNFDIKNQLVESIFFKISTLKKQIIKLFFDIKKFLSYNN